MDDRAIPLVARGNSDCMAKRLKGTDKEVWTKLLAIQFKHKAMQPAEWLAQIEKLKKVKAEAYK